MEQLKPQFKAAQELKDPAAREAAIAALMKQTAAIPPATLDDVVAHIDHAVKIAGIDHVGIGTDFDGVPCVPAGLESYDKFPNLTRALLQKGYSAKDIEKIYGGNLLRVMRAVEQRAAELKSTPPIESTVDKK
jgi:membrane dipeptidase